MQRSDMLANESAELLNELLSRQAPFGGNASSLPSYYQQQSHSTFAARPVSQLPLPAYPQELPLQQRPLKDVPRPATGQGHPGAAPTHDLLHAEKPPAAKGTTNKAASSHLSGEKMISKLDALAIASAQVDHDEQWPQEPTARARSASTSSSVASPAGKMPAVVRHSTGSPVSFLSSDGDRNETFPQKLLRLLTDAEANGDDSVVSFNPQGTAFTVHHPRHFEKRIVPKYFRHSKFTSFQRQLYLYDFEKLFHGPDKDAFTHPLFRRGRTDLLWNINRKRKKEPGERSSRKSFPRKLHRLLLSIEQAGCSDVACFQEGGAVFAILDEKEFESVWLPKAFKHSQMASFRRQLSIYGFARVFAKDEGPNVFRYRHPNFHRSHSDLLEGLKRQVDEVGRRVGPPRKSTPPRSSGGRRGRRRNAVL